MKETKKFDNWIGFLSISVVVVIVCVFTLTISNTHLAKGTYGASSVTVYSAGDSAYFNCVSATLIDQDCYMSCGQGACLDPEEDCPKVSGYQCSCKYTDKNDCESKTGKTCSNTKYLTESLGLVGIVCYGPDGQNSSTSSTSSGTSSGGSCGGCYCNSDGTECEYVSSTLISCMTKVAALTINGYTRNNKSEGQCTGCQKTDRGSGCYVCGNSQSGTRQYYTVDPEKDVCNSQRGCTRIGNTCESTASDNTRTVLLKNAEGTTGNGYFVVNRDSNKIIVFNPTKNCSKWSTVPCANADCNNGASAQDSAYSSLAVGETYTGPAVLYCKAGTSGGSGGNVTPTDKPTSTPTNSTEKPASTSTGTVKPATTTKPTNTNNNPQTGTVGIIVAWLVGLSAIVYSLWYFKKSSSIN